MIPLELTIEGLFSYSTKQRIDFGPLVDAGLFGIIGPTGSGKSAIVEAMLLALYAECPRKPRNKSIAVIMNPKSQKVSVDFTFLLDTHDGQHLYQCRYRANEKGRLLHQLFQSHSGKWRQVSGNTANEVAKLLGLDYDNFCRAILLPQGQFQNFLTLDSGDRAEALQKLFQLHRYDFSLTIRDVRQEANLSKKSLEQQLNQYRESASEELLQSLQEELEEAKAKQEELKQRHQELLHREQGFQRLAEQYQQYQRLRQELQDLHRQYPDVDERCQRLEHLLHCRERLLRPWQQLQNKLEHRRKLQDQLIPLQQAADELQNSLSPLQRRYEELRSLADSHELSPEIIQLYDDAAQAAALRERLTELDLERQELSQQLASLQHSRQRLEEELEALRKQRQRLIDELKSYAELHELVDWHSVDKALRNQHSELSDELRKCNEKIAEAEAEFLRRCGELSEEYRPQSPHSDELEQVEDRLRSAIEQHQRQHERLRQRQSAAELAQLLEPHQPCPVCGSLDHPSPALSDPHLQEELEKSLEQLSVLQGWLEYLRTLRNDYAARFEVLEGQRREIESKLESIQQKIAEHRRSFTWSGWSPDALEHQLQVARQRYGQLQQELQDLNTEERERLEQLEEYRRQELERREYYNRLSNDYAQSSSSYEHLCQRVKDYDESLLHYTQETLRKLHEELKARRQQVEEELPRVQKGLQEKQTEFDRVQGQIETLRKQLAEMEAEIDKCHQDFRAACEAEGLLLAEAQQLLQHPYDELYKELSELRDLQRRLKMLQEECDRLSTETARYQPDEHERICTERARLERELEELAERQGALKRQLEEVQQARERYAQLSQEYEKLCVRCDRIEKLARLFQGNAFINFIAASYMDGICNRANEYLRKWTYGLLELGVREGGRELCVRDFSYEGREREISTLSGGQLFQASLALALALSDMVRANSRLRRCLLFIDEGFGSLDRESLQIVMGTLHQLRRQGRLIGIISHREELQQELEAYLKVGENSSHGENSLQLARQ
ncbi:MAG: SMC family ATPase [Candidatus Kapabacteria bacterium]|nr:SMC family ATPase [Candidatus Kapabacteria bacterium]MDW8011838.1 SMC family ATPase [Bacteroidota bacterium]